MGHFEKTAIGKRGVEGQWTMVNGRGPQQFCNVKNVAVNSEN